MPKKRTNNGTAIPYWQMTNRTISSFLSLHSFRNALFSKDIIWEISTEIHKAFQSFILSLREWNKNGKIDILSILTKRLQWEGSETTSVRRVKTLSCLDVPYEGKIIQDLKSSKAKICGDFHPVHYKKKMMPCSIFFAYANFLEVCS